MYFNFLCEINIVNQLILFLSYGMIYSLFVLKVPLNTSQRTSVCDGRDAVVAAYCSC